MIHLNEIFSQAKAHIYQLKLDIASLVQEKQSVSSYYTRLKGMWDELRIYQASQTCICGCTCGAMQNVAKAHQQEHVIQFLMGLDDTFEHVRAQIILQDPLPSLNKVFSLITRAEKQRGNSFCDLAKCRECNFAFSYMVYSNSWFQQCVCEAN